MKIACRIACLVWASLAMVMPSVAAEGGIVNRIAATVNGRPITASEVKARLGPYFRELLMLYPKQGPRFNSELVKAKKAVLEDLIERELVLSDFSTKGYLMKDDAVEDEINRRILTMFNGNRSEFLDNLRKSGMTYSEYRDSVKKELTVSSMRASRYERGIPPTPDEIRAEYQESKADYRDITKDRIRFDKIFIPAMDPEDPMTSPEEQYKKAMSIKEEIDKGAISFAEAARQHSRDRMAAEGGAWPIMSRSELSVDFSNVVFSMQPGEVFGPLLDPAGFTIVRVRERRLASPPPLSNSEVKQRVDDAVRRKQSEKRYRQWIERLKKKAIIRKFI